MKTQIEKGKNVIRISTTITQSDASFLKQRGFSPAFILRRAIEELRNNDGEHAETTITALKRGKEQKEQQLRHAQEVLHFVLKETSTILPAEQFQEILNKIS